MGSALSKLVTNLTIVCIGALRIIIALAPTRPVYHALRTNEAPMAKLASVTTMSQLSRDNLRVHPQRKYLTKNFPSKALKSHTPKSKNRWDIVLPEFHLFTKLPPELRLLIWEAARPGPRVVKIFQVKSDKDFRIVYSKAKVPSLLHACIESRQVALKWYQLSFGHMHIVPSTVYFDMSADFVHFQCQKCRGRLHECDMQTCGLSVLSYYSRGKSRG